VKVRTAIKDKKMSLFRHNSIQSLLSRAGLAFCVCVAFAPNGMAQQKGQYVPGQYGLNSGVIPDPGVTYMNLAINYSASQLNDSSGSPRPNVSGTYAFWVDENIFMYVPKFKFLGGYFAPYIAINVANGSLVADISGTNLGATGGGAGLADTWVEPINLGWHFPRLDANIGYAFVAPTGRFTAGASNNVGSGYWGNHLTDAATYYITKNKATSANIFTDWEGHTQKSGTNITPGQTLTLEWGLGQTLPLAKDLSKLVQIGLVGYDQWAVSSNSGTIGPGIPASSLPKYAVHALGTQVNFTMPAKNFLLFFKYYGEYSAKSRVLGRTIVFGGNYTFKTPKS
jgi:hypothetical protein